MCDGLFLILDTAKHNGFEVDPQEITDHMTECRECIMDDLAYGDWAEEVYDPDAPIGYWPADVGPWDTLTEVDGHA